MCGVVLRGWEVAAVFTEHTYNCRLEDVFANISGLHSFTALIEHAFKSPDAWLLNELSCMLVRRVSVLQWWLQAVAF